MPVLLQSQSQTSFTVFGDCAGCEERRGFQCNVEVDGDAIDVRTSIELRERDGMCAAACGIPEETCTLPALEAGTYVVTFHDGQAGWTTEIEVGEVVGAQECRADGIDAFPPEERDQCPFSCS